MIRLAGLRTIPRLTENQRHILPPPICHATTLQTAIRPQVAPSFQSVRTKWHRIPTSPQSKIVENDPDDEELDEEEQERLHKEEEDMWLRHGFQAPDFCRGAVIKVGQHTNVTAAGRVNSTSVLCVLGDGKGTAGIGYGKGEDFSVALEAAHKDVLKNLVSVYRYEDRTISHDITLKYKATKLILRRHQRGAGLRGNANLAALAHAFGFEDLLFKVHGSANKRTTLHAFMEGVQQSVSPADVARMTGKVFIDPSKVLNPKLGETPFKFNNMTSHNLWNDDRIFQDSNSILDKGITVKGEPEVDIKEKELRVSKLYKRRMEELKKEVPEIDQKTIDHARKVLQRDEHSQ